MQLDKFVDVLYYPVTSSWHFTLFHEEDERSNNPQIPTVEFLWYVNFSVTIIISPMRLIGVQYISDFAVCDRPNQAADHSLNPQLRLKVLQ